MALIRTLRSALALPLLALLACTPTGSGKLESYIPDTVSTAYMLFYEFNSPTTIDGKDILKELAAVLLFTGATAMVNGFRDGAEEEGMDQARVDEIRKFLIAQGVEPSRFQVLARGVAPMISATDDGAASRRVEVFIQPPL
jgi:outer membrane protein OmpA-like peptidoglycan-associated protein